MKRKLPQQTVGAKPDSKFSVSISALNRWNPGIKAAVDEGNSISIMGVIGEDFMGEGITVKSISNQLRRIGNNDVVININSPGGDFFEGLAIYNLLREHPKDVTVNILGLAASAASTIAMGGDTVKIARAGFLMIHNAWAIAMGDKHDLRDVADYLDPLDKAYAEILTARAGMDRKTVLDMMDKETWFSGEKAVSLKLADELLASDASKSGARQEFESNLSIRTLDTILAKSGVTRSERNKLFKSLTTTRDAGDDGTRDAAMQQELGALTSYFQSIKCEV